MAADHSQSEACAREVNNDFRKDGVMQARLSQHTQRGRDFREEGGKMGSVSPDCIVPCFVGKFAPVQPSREPLHPVTLPR
jgi:hypothetical protein